MRHRCLLWACAALLIALAVSYPLPQLHSAPLFQDEYERLVVVDADGNLFVVVGNELRSVAPPLITTDFLAPFQVGDPVGSRLAGALIEEGELVVSPDGVLWWLVAGTSQPVDLLPIAADEGLWALAVGAPLDLTGAEERAAAALAAVVPVPTPTPPLVVAPPTPPAPVPTPPPAVAVVAVPPLAIPTALAAAAPTPSPVAAPTAAPWETARLTTWPPQPHRDIQFTLPPQWRPYTGARSFQLAGQTLVTSLYRPIRGVPIIWVTALPEGDYAKDTAASMLRRSLVFDEKEATALLDENTRAPRSVDELMSSARSLAVGGTPALAVDYEWTRRAGRVWQTVIVLKRGNVFWNIQYWSLTPQEFRDSKPDLDKFLASATFGY